MTSRWFRYRWMAYVYFYLMKLRGCHPRKPVKFYMYFLSNNVWEVSYYDLPKRS